MFDARVRLSTELNSDSTSELFESDRKKFRASEMEAAKYLQENDHEYPTMDLAVVAGYYRHIIEIIHCKEIPLSSRFLSLDHVVYRGPVPTLTISTNINMICFKSIENDIICYIAYLSYCGIHSVDIR